MTSTPTACSCTKIPAERAITVMGRMGVTLAIYDKMCETHGVEVLSETPMEEIRVKRWVTRAELRTMGNKIGMKLLQVAPDRNRGEVEWSEWLSAFTPRKEQAA